LSAWDSSVGTAIMMRVAYMIWMAWILRFADFSFSKPSLQFLF
jgi:hypothetical protein